MKIFNLKTKLFMFLVLIFYRYSDKAEDIFSSAPEDPSTDFNVQM